MTITKTISSVDYNQFQCGKSRRYQVTITEKAVSRSTSSVDVDVVCREDSLSGSTLTINGRSVTLLKLLDLLSNLP